MKNIICYEIIPIPQVKTLFGESPHWDDKTQSLYYCDIFATNTSTIFRYDYKEGKIYPAMIKNEQMASFIIPIKNCKNQFAVGLNRGVKVIHWDGISPIAIVIRDLFQVEYDPRYAKNHMHTGKADAKGRLYCGTFRTELCSPSNASYASFYRYSKKNGVKRLVKNIKLSAGIAWNEEARKLYHIDSCNFILKEYDWNPKTGRLCNRRIAFNFYDGNGLPNYVPVGMDIDCDGNLWVVMYNTSSIWKINPRTSMLLEKIEMPTPIFANLAFGAPNLDTMFVTTGTVASDIYSGAPLNATLPPSAGMLIMIKGLRSEGHCGRKLSCI